MKEEKRDRIQDTILAQASLNAQGPLKFEQMPGDASSRNYFRVYDQSHQSWIVMEFDSSSTSLADEKTPELEHKIVELPFVNVQRVLRAGNVSVPAIHAQGDGFLVLQDLGSVSLFDWIEQQPATEAIMKHYQIAIDELLKLQQISIINQSDFIATTRRFDQSILAWEFDHFLEYGIEKPLAKSKRDEELQNYFYAMSEKIAGFPVCLVHRDYHSKNLMINGEHKFWVIDFQDALIGPVHYDLASLLFDSYVDLSEAMVRELTRYYYDRALNDLVGDSFEQFCVELRMVALQRNLKAAGRFVYIYMEKGKTTHLQFVAPTLKKASQHLDALGANSRFTNRLPFAQISQKVREMMS